MADRDRGEPARNFLRSKAAVEEAQDVAGEGRADAVDRALLERGPKRVDRLFVVILDGPDAESQLLRDLLVGQAVGL